MDSTEAWERRKRFVSALSSRSRPSNKCSVSIYGEPNWLASYRAKKMTRRAFSVYRSNMFPLKKCPRRNQRQLSSCSIFPELAAPGKPLGWADISWNQSYIGSTNLTTHPFGEARCRTAPPLKPLAETALQPVHGPTAIPAHNASPEAGCG